MESLHAYTASRAASAVRLLSSLQKGRRDKVTCPRPKKSKGLIISGIRQIFMKRGLRFLLIADAWVNLALGMIGPIYAIFVEQIGGDILDASWAYFTYMLTAGIAPLTRFTHIM